MKVNKFNIPEEHMEFITEALTQINYRNIKLSTDWHLFKEKDGKVTKNPKSEELIKLQNKYVSDNDIFIQLWDLCDDNTTE